MVLAVLAQDSPQEQHHSSHPVVSHQSSGLFSSNISRMQCLFNYHQQLPAKPGCKCAGQTDHQVYAARQAANNAQAAQERQAAAAAAQAAQAAQALAADDTSQNQTRRLHSLCGTSVVIVGPRISLVKRQKTQ